MRRNETQPSLSSMARIACATTIGGLAAFASYEVAPEITGLFKDDHQRSHNQSLEGLASYYSLDGKDLGADYFQLLVDQYNMARDSFSNFSLYELKTNHTSETIDFVREGRKKLLIDGARIFSLLAADKETVGIGTDEDWVEVKGIKFDLDNAYHAFLLDGVIRNSILMYAPDASDLQVYEANKRRGDLLWIAHEDLPIEIEDDTWGFAPENVFINMSRFYQRIKALGYPIPSHMFFRFHRPDDPGGAWYDDRLNDSYVTNESGDASIVHEWAHNQSDENPKFSLESYIDAFFNEEIWDKAFSPDSFINPGVLDDKDNEGTIMEDYAENLRVFFEDGTGYRQKLKELFLTNSPSYKLVLAKYNYAREFYGGDEFLTNGERFLPRKGDIFVIYDPDEFARGICLRPEPSYGVGQAPLVFNGDQVQILEGPVTVRGPLGDDREIYRVMYASGGGEDPIFVYPNIEGWMWSLWLGERSMVAKVANSIPKVYSLQSVEDSPCP